MSDLITSTEVAVRNKFGQFSKELDDARRIFLDEIADVGENAARLTAPVKSGRLKDSITGLVFPGTRTASVVTKVSYGLYQEEGTRRHPITGNPDLSFFWKKAGRRFYPASEFYNTPGMVTVIDHPGNPAVGFLARGYDEMIRQTPNMLRRAYARV